MLVIGKKIHQYTILQIVGKGGCSTVYLGKKEATLYAIKEVKNEYREFAIREMEILKRCDHPCIVRGIELFEYEGLIYLVLEYIEGMTLERYAKRKLSKKEIIDLSMQLCKIVLYLHEQDRPIIHRDLKPSNMIVDSSCHLHLIDFGISEYCNDSKISHTFGTRGYSAPELYRNIQANRSNDIYSIGMIFLYLLKGKPSFTWVLKGNDQYERIIEKCIQEDPCERYQSVAKILVDLKKIRRKRLCVYKWKLWS